MSRFWDARNNRPNSYTAGTRARAAHVNANEQFLEKRSFNSVIVVDASGTIGTHCDFNTIQAALNQCNTDGFGYTIIVRDGTYTENLSTTRAGITIIGESKNGTIVQSTNGTKTLSIGHSYFSIRNCTIKKTTSNTNVIGITSYGLTHIDIRGNYITSNQNEYIFSLPSTGALSGVNEYIWIQNNRIESTGASASALIGFETTSSSGDVNVELNKLFILNNTLTSTSTTNTQGMIWLHASTGTSTTKSEIKQVVISGNYIECVGAVTSIYTLTLGVENNANCLITSVSVDNNVIVGNGATNNYGIYLNRAGSNGILRRISIGTGNCFAGDIKTNNTEILLSSTYPTEFSTGGRMISWTPTLSGDGTITYGTTTVNVAKFCIIGRRVFFNLRCTGTTGGSASTDLRFTLPITPLTTTDDYIGGGCSVDDGSGNLSGTWAWNNGAAAVDVKKYDRSNWGLGAGRELLVQGQYDI